jgi:hypothetical protein
MTNYFLVGGDVPVDSEALLVTDFVNLKIKPTQSFRGAHRGRVCVRVFIGVSAHTCISICIYTVFLKKNLLGLVLASPLTARRQIFVVVFCEGELH